VARVQFSGDREGASELLKATEM